VFALFVVLVLAVGGLLLWRAASARPVPAAETRAVLSEISCDAVVRRSPFFASRAPGLLCERAFVFFSRHANGRALSCARFFASARDAARSSPALC